MVVSPEKVNARVYPAYRQTEIEDPNPFRYLLNSV